MTATLVERAIAEMATRNRYWTPFSEDVSLFDSGDGRFRALLGSPFDLGQPGAIGTVGGERSPYGFDLGITYPRLDPDVLLPAMRAAVPGWANAGIEVRSQVCERIVLALEELSGDLAHAAMHASGHGTLMAWHGTRHALDRALEAVAMATVEQTRVPRNVVWTKAGISLAKSFRAVPRGIGLVHGCDVFPLWNGFPPLFASLATGNAVVLTPHPGAILPLALVVRTARSVLERSGFSPDLVCLAPGDDLSGHPLVSMVDGAGTAVPRTGRYHSHGATPLVIEATGDYRGLIRNTATSLCLYSGQLPASIRTVVLPVTGVETGSGVLAPDRVIADLIAGIGAIVAEEDSAAYLLGALVDPSSDEIDPAEDVLLAPGPVRHPGFPRARVRSPGLVRVGQDRAADRPGKPGPVFQVTVADDPVEVAREIVERQGAYVIGTHTRRHEVWEALGADLGVSVTANLTGDWFLSQSAVYSDFHGAASPAANATFCDSAYVADRFRWIQLSRQIE